MSNRVIVFMVFLCGLCGYSGAQLTLLDGNYRIETLASYYNVGQNIRMEADSYGNVYIDHYDTGEIYRMTPARQTSLFANGLAGALDMCWTGGSAYGDYLYVNLDKQTETDKIIRIDAQGAKYDFADQDMGYAPAMTLDRTGTYNNRLYFGRSSEDEYLKVTPDGTVSTFTSWPGEKGYSSPCGLDIDPTGHYGGFMYAARTCDPSRQNPYWGGIFKMMPDGSVTKFSSAIGHAMHLEFGPDETFFENNMFVEGWDVVNTGHRAIWKVNPDGTALEFIATPGYSGAQFCFAPDGNMYIGQYDWFSQNVIISRVVPIPEPAMMSLMFVGIYGMFRRLSKTHR